MGSTSGAWDIPASLKCPVRAHPSFGSAPHTYGRWTEEGTGKYRLECTIRAAGTGATSGSGLWMLRLPRLDGYQLQITSPGFADGRPMNSQMIGYGQIGAGNGAHLGPVSVHTRSDIPTTESTQNDQYLVFAKKGSLFVGGGAWLPANLHAASHRAFPCTWVAV